MPDSERGDRRVRPPDAGLLHPVPAESIGTNLRPPADVPYHPRVRPPPSQPGSSPGSAPVRPALLVLREFRALLGARLTNALAGSALATVVAYQVYILTRDPLALGWLGLVEAIPALSLAIFGGHVADLRDRRTIVVIASAVVTMSAVALTLLAGSGSPSLLGILGVIFVTGVASGFERPAHTALEAQVIPRSEAARGISVLSSVSLGGAIAGPAVGGIAIAVVGVTATYAAHRGALRRLDRLPRDDLAQAGPGPDRR